METAAASVWQTFHCAKCAAETMDEIKCQSVQIKMHRDSNSFVSQPPPPTPAAALSCTLGLFNWDDTKQISLEKNYIPMGRGNWLKLYLLCPIWLCPFVATIARLVCLGCFDRLHCQHMVWFDSGQRAAEQQAASSEQFYRKSSCTRDSLERPQLI